MARATPGLIHQRADIRDFVCDRRGAGRRHHWQRVAQDGGPGARGGAQADGRVVAGGAGLAAEWERAVLTKDSAWKRHLNATCTQQILRSSPVRRYPPVSSGILRIEGRDAPAMSEPFNTILEEIASELELRPLLTSIITRACELLGADGGSIGLYVPRRHTVQVEAIHQLPLTELGMEFEPGEGLIGKVLATGRPVIVDRYGELQRISLPEMRDYTVIGVPIPGPGGGLLGVFGIGAPPPRKFGASDLDTLRLFARHAAIAIQNAMRYEREKRRTERMTLIAHIARVITAGLDAKRAGRDGGAGDSRAPGLSQRRHPAALSRRGRRISDVRRTRRQLRRRHGSVASACR